MGGGILGRLLSGLDDMAYRGVQGLSKYPNGIGIGRETLRQKGNVLGDDIDSLFKNQSAAPLLRKDRLQIRDTGGGGAPLLQEFYEKLTKK